MGDALPLRDVERIPGVKSGQTKGLAALEPTHHKQRLL